MEAKDIRHRRLGNQRIECGGKDSASSIKTNRKDKSGSKDSHTNSPGLTPAALVSWMGGVQAQHYGMSKWAIGLRLQSATAKSPAYTQSLIEKALDEGAILRTHIMRPTWHLVAAEDLLWLLKLTAPGIQRFLFSRDKILGIQAKEYLKANKVIQKVLEKEPALTRELLLERLKAYKLPLDEYRKNHYLIHAELEGLICSGPAAGKKTTYALVAERLGKKFDELESLAGKLSRQEATARLALRYFQSHGPATLQDFQWWSGLQITLIRSAMALVADQLQATDFDGQTYWQTGQTPLSGPPVHKYSECCYLLPAFDEYLISYKDRSAAIDSMHSSKAFTLNGIFRPVVVFRGQVVATWDKTIQKNGMKLELRPFTPMTATFAKEARRAAKMYSMFVEVPITDFSILAP